MGGSTFPGHCMARRTSKHNYTPWEEAFIAGQYDSIVDLRKAWASKARGTNEKAPAESTIEQYAAKYKWWDRRNAVQEKARQIHDQKLAEKRAKLMLQAEETYSQHEHIGMTLLKMGGDYITALEHAKKLAAKAGRYRDGAITKTSEALAFMRTGAILVQKSTQGKLALLPEPAKPTTAPTVQGVTKEELDGDEDTRTPDEIRQDIQRRILRIADAKKTGKPS